MQITFLQNFERVEVVAFDVEIFSGVEVAAVGDYRSESFSNRRVSFESGAFLADEIKDVSLATFQKFVR